MREAYSSEQVGDFTVNIHFDQDPMNPREDFDQIGTMVYWSNRYTIGDVDGSKEFGEPRDFIEWAEENGMVYLPVYAYIHSGITISTKGFGCPWDSGQVGFIYGDPKSIDWLEEDASEEQRVEKLKNVLEGEIKIFDDYLTGQVFGFEIEDENGDIAESCWGFYGDDKYALDEGISIAKSLQQEKEDNEITKFATLYANA